MLVFFLFFYTSGHATLYSCASCSLHKVILSNGQVEAEIQLMLHLPGPSWCTAVHWKGAAFVIHSKVQYGLVMILL